MRTAALFLLLTACGTEWKVVDDDGDGFTAADGDCNDKDGEIGPGATEIWYDGKDQDCAGDDDFDQDKDGHRTLYRLEPGYTGTLPVDDCFDALSDPFSNNAGLSPIEVNPEAAETYYDGTDSNCDSLSDYDQDLDGFDSATHPDANGGLGDDCYDAADDPFDNPEGLAPDAVNPNADEVWYGGTDGDCDGQNDYDQDGDGASCTSTPDSEGFCDGDCDDFDAAQRPNDAEEIWYNGIDENCDGNDTDQDGDGQAALDVGGTDCNDLDADIYQGAAETWYDAIDQDCAGDSDYDQDKDGYSSGDYGGTDCDDTDENVYPDVAEVYYDGIDANCDGQSDYDQDLDGEETSLYGGTDCNDFDASVYAAADEICGNNQDDNCDGDQNSVDASGCSDFYYDADGDTYGINGAASACYCVAAAPYTGVATGDCNDGEANANPGIAQEDCLTDYDDNCSNGTNETNADNCTTWYYDADGDSYGRDDTTTCSCELPDTYSTIAGDCDDSRSSAYPGATEVCDGVDNDCDDDTDEDLTLYYVDSDDDGYGSASTTGTCYVLSGYVTDNTDCDDADPWVLPGGTEYCDGVRNDCNDTGWDDSVEDGMVTKESSDGDTRTNQTWNTDPATEGSTSISSASDDGAAWYICRGTYYQSLVINVSNLDASFIGVYGSDETILDGNGTAGSVVSITHSRISLHGLTIQNGLGSSSTYGGGVIVAASSSTQGNSTTPNLYMEDCAITSNSSVYGGGLVVGNSSSAPYGYAHLVNTVVYDNSASNVGGGAWINNGTLECESDGADAGIYANTATLGGGGVYIQGSGSLISSGCDWGTDADDNSPTDVAGGSFGTSSKGADETFTCTAAAGCN